MIIRAQAQFFWRTHASTQHVVESIWSRFLGHSSYLGFCSPQMSGFVRGTV